MATHVQDFLYSGRVVHLLLVLDRPGLHGVLVHVCVRYSIVHLALRLLPPTSSASTCPPGVAIVRVVLVIGQLPLLLLCWSLFCNRFLLLRCFLRPHVFIAPVLAGLAVTNLLIGLVVLRATAAPPRLVPGTSPDPIELGVLGPVRLRRGNRPSWFSGRFDRAWLV